MTRPKNNGGRHTPKDGHSSQDGGAPTFGMGGLPDIPSIDPEAFEQAIMDSTIDINDMDPNDLDLEALGLGDADPLDIIIARMIQSLDEGAAQFLEEAAGAAWMIHDTTPEGERAEAVERFSGIEEISDSLMAALTVLGLTEEVKAAAASVEPLAPNKLPAWLRRLDKASVTSAAIGRYQPDDEVEVLAEITIPSVNPFVLVINRSKVVHELITEISSLIEPLEHLTADVNGDELIELTIEPTDLQTAADELALSLTPSIEWAATAETGGLPVDNGVETVLPLAAWVAAMLPASEVEPFFGFEGEQRDLGLSRYTAESDIAPDSEQLKWLGMALDFSVEQDPFRWSPRRLVTMFERVSMFIDDPKAFVDALRDFLRFAATVEPMDTGGRVGKDSAEVLSHNLTVLDSVIEHSDELFNN